MSIGREALRRAAKKVYKENVKDIPKRKRVPFSEFFKQYKTSKKTNEVPDVEMLEPESEDFDFENLVNVSEINDDDLEESSNGDDKVVDQDA